MKTVEECIATITEYLSVGGLFNPEAMEHDKVRDLLIDCREALSSAHLAGELSGMTEAALIAGNAVRSEKDYSQNFARDKCIKAIVAARDAKALAAKDGK